MPGGTHATRPDGEAVTEEQLALLKSLTLQWERDAVDPRVEPGAASALEGCAYELTALLEDMAKQGDS